MAMNRIKAVLAEKQLTSKWLPKSWVSQKTRSLVGGPIGCNPLSEVFLKLLMP